MVRSEAEEEDRGGGGERIEKTRIQARREEDGERDEDRENRGEKREEQRKIEESRGDERRREETRGDKRNIERASLPISSLCRPESH